jgi:hypothetical protein
LTLGVVSVADEEVLAGMVRRSGLEGMLDFALSSEAAR